MRFFFIKTIFFFLFINFAQANNDIRFIDINYIVDNSITGKNLNQVIEKKNKKIADELKILGKKLEKQKNKIVSQKNILKKEDLDNLVKVYENEVREFNEIRKKKLDEFNSFNIRSKKKIIDLLNPLITTYLEKESIQMLLQKDKIIFGNDTLDITKEILKLFDSKHKKIQFE
tara:strand:+ start:1127 stop:1645 length:519 start_codon:yes stop_codon:yes gene_type:complete